MCFLLNIHKFHNSIIQTLVRACNGVSKPCVMRQSGMVRRALRRAAAGSGLPALPSSPASPTPCGLALPANFSNIRRGFPSNSLQLIMKIKLIACCIMAALQQCCFAQGGGGGGVAVRLPPPQSGRR